MIYKSHLCCTLADLAEELKVMIWQMMQTHLKYIWGAQEGSNPHDKFSHDKIRPAVR